MSWNYRILAHYKKDEICFQIHEVHYNKKGLPHLYTKYPVPVSGGNASEIQEVLDMMRFAFNKPVLWAGERFPEEYNNNS